MLGQSLIFGPDDPARVRFAVSPLLETLKAVRVLLEPHRQPYHAPWLEAVRPRLRRLELWPLLALTPLRGWTPDFLIPAPAGPGADVAAQLAQVRATAPEQVLAEVRRSLTERAGARPPEAAWRLLDDPARTRDQLADLIGQCWDALLAPHWPRLADLLEADVSYRTLTLAGYGLEHVLSGLDRRVRWTGRAIVVDRPASGSRRLGGAGLVLLPSAFAWPDTMAVIDPPATPMLVYPARGIAGLWRPAPAGQSQALARLLGKSRAALLESLAEPAATDTLARRHGLAPSTVSEHLTALHDARLVARHRHGRRVLYQRTPLGEDLAGG